MAAISRFLLVFAVIAAASPAQDEVPVFSSTTRLVQFSLIALDKNGKALTDLRMDEVEVLEKGKPRSLAFFRFDGAGAPESKRAEQPLPPGIFTNRVEYTPGPPRNVVALVLDTLNTGTLDQMWVRAQLMRYLKTMGPETRVAVYHLGNQLRILHDFTDDAAALRARIAKDSLQLPVQAATDMDRTIREAEQLIAMFPDDPSLAAFLKTQVETEMLYNAQVRQRKVEMTLAAMGSLGAHLTGIPGRKSMVWIGGGISMLTVTGAMGFGPRGSTQSHETLIRDSSRKLAQQNIALYVVDAKGLTGPTDASASLAGANPLPGRGRFERQQQAEQISADPLPAANTFASITGGRVIRNTNDPAEGMRQAERDVGGAYTVGFYAAGEPDGKWHSLKVRVKRPGAKVVYREGFLAEAGGSLLAEWTPDDWQSAARNPLGSTAISLDARCGRAPGNQQTLMLVLQIDSRHLYFQKDSEGMVANIEIGLAEKMPSGQTSFYRETGEYRLTREQLAGVRPASVRYSRSWVPAQGIASVRVLVRDRVTGRYGTLELPVKNIPVEPVPGAR
jgi:VWFA-related protein